MATVAGPTWWRRSAERALQGRFGSIEHGFSEHLLGAFEELCWGGKATRDRRKRSAPLSWKSGFV